jgi:hypothetical protein
MSFHQSWATTLCNEWQDDKKPHRDLGSDLPKHINIRHFPYISAPGEIFIVLGIPQWMSVMRQE